MKTAFVTTATRTFLPHLRALLNSIKINSPSVTDIPFICFTGTNNTVAIREKASSQSCHVNFDSALSWKEKQQLKELYPSIEVKNTPMANYVSGSKFSPFFWRMEVFNLRGYDKVIFIDADMLCIKDISGLLNIECDIGTTEQTKGWKDWNWGLFIVGKKYLNSKTYKWLLNSRHDPTKPAEPMHLFSKLFGDALYEIPQRYNRIVPQLSVDEMFKHEMIHYIYKPLTELEGHIKPEYLDLWKKYSV